MIFRTNKITNYTKIDNRYLDVEKTYDESGRFIYEYIIYEYPDDPKGHLDLS